MLQRLNYHYLFLSLFVFFFFLKNIETDFIPLYLINFFTIVVYFGTINYCSRRPESFYSKKSLRNIVFIYSLTFVSIYNAISFYYNGNFFVFSEMDAAVYDIASIRMASMGFWEGIQYFLQDWTTEDLGVVLVISTLYRLIESNLFLNFFYIFCGVFTSLGIFRIAKHFISTKYSFLCALTYSISSFVLWFHSSGLKESFMVMLIVLFFDQYYQFVINKKSKSVLLGVMLLLSLLLFRPALVFLCLGSIGIGLLLSRKINVVTLLLMFSIFLSSIFAYSYITAYANRVLGNSTEEMISAKEASGMVKEGVKFTYAVNILAASIGPLPTIIPNDKKQMLSIFSVGLLYRITLSSTFLLGIYYVFRRKISIAFPLVLFLLMEMFSLVFIMEALELRKSLPHFSMIFIVSFWFIDRFSEKDFFSFQTKTYLNRISKVSIVILLFLIIFWNYRN